MPPFYACRGTTALTRTAAGGTLTGHFPRLVEDSQLSPLDLAITPNSNIVVSC